MVSGGLDSMLAAKIVADQGIDIFPVRFTSPFYPSDNFDVPGADIPEILGIPVKTEFAKDLVKEAALRTDLDCSGDAVECEDAAS